MGVGSNRSKTSGSLAAGKLNVALIIGKNIGIVCNLITSGSFSVVGVLFVAPRTTTILCVLVFLFFDDLDCDIRRADVDLLFMSCLFVSLGESRIIYRNVF